MTKRSLAGASGGNRVEVRGSDDADAAALHLLEEVAAAHVAHKEHHLHRLDVGAGGDHVHRDHDAGVEAVAELVNQYLRGSAGGAVGDLLAEVVALGELLPNDVDDIVRVAVVLGEDDGLGHVFAAWENLGVDAVAESLNDRADLVHRDHGPVKLTWGIGQIILQLLPADLAGEAVAPVHLVSRFDDAPVTGYLRLNAIDVVVDVDPVNHCLPVVVLHHQVLVEEAKDLLRGRGGQADEEGVEVVPAPAATGRRWSGGTRRR